MEKINVKQIAALAEDTGVFKKHEIEILEELLTDCKKNGDKNYTLNIEYIDNTPVGFTISGRTPMTDFCWDMYWIIVDKNQHCRGIGSKLIKKMEDYILENCDKAVIRVETSSKDMYAPARKLYLKNGYIQTGLIADFYAEGDSLCIFSKKIEKIKNI